MLQSLHIKNFTLIDQLDIDFTPGFSVITGETGAGKSILLGALSLVLGKRAEAALLRDNAKKCIIEGIFDVMKYPDLKVFFKANALEYSNPCILRRELLPSGKSRAFVNDSPVTLDILSKVSSFLIDIHSQHQTLDIFDQQYQLGVIDGLANHKDLLVAYRALYHEHQTALKDLKVLEDQHAQAMKESDYNNFLLDEIDKYSWREGLLEDLEDQRLQLENASEIVALLATSIHLLNNESSGLIDQLQQLNTTVQKLSGFGGKYEDLSNRIKAVQIELLDVGETLEGATADTTQEDPLLLDEVHAQLKVVYDLFRKHQVDNVSDLLKFRAILEDKVNKVIHGEEEIEAQKKQLATLEEQLMKLALKLRDQRNKTIPSFVKQLTEKLHILEMPKAVFKVQLTPKKDFSISGLDQVDFLFSGNSGTDFGPLKKIASGGELSRIMMSIKALLSVHVSLPTIIFDEIDTGVSGEVATKIAHIMKEMGKDIQLVSITHLPQVAAKGDVHFMVYKKDNGAETQTQLSILDHEQRVVAIAEMLGGKTLSASAIAHAKQLLA